MTEQGFLVLNEIGFIFPFYLEGQGLMRHDSFLASIGLGEHFKEFGADIVSRDYIMEPLFSVVFRGAYGLRDLVLAGTGVIMRTLSIM